MRYIRTLGILIAAILMTAILAGCTHTNSRPECPNDEATHANGLELYRDGNCWVAKVISPVDSIQDLGVYIFPDTDTTSNIPDIAGAKVFPPSRRGSMMVYTSVYTSALKDLGAEDMITVCGDVPYMTDDYVLGRISDGTIVDGGMQQEPVSERIIAARPDFILLSHYDGIDASKLEKLGIPIVYMRESAETDPLGRAEWIKLIGLLCGKKEQADSIFALSASRYAQLKDKVAQCKEPRPKVMTETIYQGTWYLPGGKSYVSTLIRDAGGEYAWADDDTPGTLSLSFEEVLNKAADSDIWLIRLFGQKLTLAELAQMDSRYKLFKPYSTSGVWSVDTKEQRFFEDTPFHPDLLLREYVSVLHPSVEGVGEPKYFKLAK